VDAHLADLTDPHETIPSQAGNSGRVLGTNGSILSWVTGGGGGGSVPDYFMIANTGLSPGDVHISGASNWDTSRAVLKSMAVSTSSTDWDIWLLWNDNGYAVNDASVPAAQVLGGGNGDETVLLDLAYEDEDLSNEVHLYLVDNSGANTFDIHVMGTELA